ncbi:MAG: YggS family pyridoxal phosphate-dependent enzyme [Oscillospiraceae bacterium]|jgi:pyridoxal phosphate enzyme (YggS family)|nr:YggS family pyridoxal phosphate-dependent enzyme [Oscillospiraceae bacterium]
MIEISENFKRISENIKKACLDFNRKDEVRFMAVTKGVPYERINCALELGIDLIGENRAQEFVQKHPFYAKKCEIHFIGGLQNNKVRYIIDKVSVIQSADSVKLLTEINKRAAAHSLTMDILIEINIGCEWSKNGIEADLLPGLLAEAETLKNVRTRGLMAIPPIDAEEKIYANMRRLYEDAKASVKQPDVFDTLSMGMSGDYITAIKHGANIIRIGSALFGSR